MKNKIEARFVEYTKVKDVASVLQELERNAYICGELVCIPKDIFYKIIVDNVA